MIKTFFKAVWEILVDVAEAKQARLKKTGYSMWY